MSDFLDVSDDEPPIFYESRTQKLPDQDRKDNTQSSSGSDSEIVILSNHDKNSENESQHDFKINDSNKIHKKDLIDTLNLSDSDSSSESVQLCSSPVNHNFPTLLENLSSSQPTPVSSEPFKRQENSQPIILSVCSESDTDISEKSDFQDLNFDSIRHESENSQNSQERFNFSFPFNKNQAQQSRVNQNNEHIGNYRQMTAATKEKEQKFRNRISTARDKFVGEVLEAIKDLNAPIPFDVDISRPPVYEAMSDEELTQELAGFGFRFKSREDAISKLFRCWAAVREKETLHSNLNANRTNNTVSNPIDFIRIHSKYYEQILIYQSIPLASLYREMTEAGIKISINRLKSILDDEGVAFSDDTNAIHPAK